MGRKAVKPGEAQKDPYLELAKHLRTKHGVEWRTGVAHNERVEYFRGKDFANYFKEHPRELEKLPGMEPLRPGRTLDAQIADVHVNMVRRRLYLRAERLHKKPKPGRKNLVKWPKKLVYEENQEFSEDGFFCWQFERPTSPWMWLGSAALVVIVFALCLFPLAPYSVKISVVYLSMGVMASILGMLLVRAIVFSIIWILLGRFFWLLPNITSDELGIIESFQPLYAWSKDEDGKDLPAPNFLYRIGVGICAALAIYGLHEYAPDGATVKTGLGKAHDGILDFLNLHEAGLKRIADANATLKMSAKNGTMGADATMSESDGASKDPTIDDTDDDIPPFHEEEEEEEEFPPFHEEEEEIENAASESAGDKAEF